MNIKEYKKWLEIILEKGIPKTNIVDDIFSLDIPNEIKTDMVELINQVELQDINILPKTPEFLMEYYVVRVHDNSNVNDFLEKRRLLMDRLYKDFDFRKLYSTYVEFENEVMSKLDTD